MPYANEADRAAWARRKRASDPEWAEKQREAVRRSGRKLYADDLYRTRKLKQRAAVRYNLSVDEYDAFFEVHGNKCGICGVSHVDEPNKRLSIDHCHETGVLRGTLCNACNLGLGKLGDTVDALKRALAYLEKSYD